MIFARKQETTPLSAAVVETKQLKPLLLIIALLFSTPAWAEEIIMLCKDEYFEEAYRYTEKLFGDDIVEIRVDGRWEIWPLPKKISLMKAS